MQLIWSKIDVWIKRENKLEEKREKAVKYVLTLIINEIVEATVRLAFLFILLLSFYGPNANYCSNKKLPFSLYLN